MNRMPAEKLPVSVAVLMGGESRRFGSPKAFQHFRGSSLAASLLQEASRFSGDVFAVCRTEAQIPEDARGRFPWALDLWKKKGPLSGLHAALQKMKKPVLFLTAVDMPFLKRDVVAGLSDLWKRNGEPDVVVPRLEGRWEPLCALWSRTTLGALEDGGWDRFQGLLSSGLLRVREVRKEELARFDPGLDCLRNFNTREEWKGRMEMLH